MVAAVPPAVGLARIREAVEAQFGLFGDYAPLVSERDQNFCLTTAGGDKYVVKVTSAVEPGVVSEFQIAALLHLENRGPGVPRVIRTMDGRYSGKVACGEDDSRRRLGSDLAGGPLASVAIEHALAREFGAVLARLDAGLQDFSHPGDRPVLLWDLQRAAELRGLLVHINRPDTRRSVERVLDDFEVAVMPALEALRCQVIHGDANPGNVLVDPVSRRVAGLIDVGDMLRAPLVFDVAIAASYLRGEDTNPLQQMIPFFAGYCSVMSLSDLEKALLFDLVRTRLATTITLLFWRLGARPDDDPYRTKTMREEADAIRFLGALESLGRAEFTARIADAI